EVEREDDAVADLGVPAQLVERRFVALALAAEDEIAQPAFQPGPASGGIGEAAVHPESQIGKGLAQPFKDDPVIAVALYRVEIGDINGGERIKGTERADHGERVGARAQAGSYRTIGVALP